jgi:two-component system phosphate regulon sensor histidine kinase PhoR
MPLGFFFVPAVLLAAAVGLAAGAMLGGGWQSAAPVVLMALVLLIGQIIVLRPLLVGLQRIRQNIGALIEGGQPTGEIWTTNPRVNDLWRAIMRLDRSHRRHAQQLATEVKTARAVLAALPDPLLLIDATRRIRQLNGAATGLFGSGVTDRDLAIAIRNPAVLAAVDAVLQGGPARLVEFEWGSPVARNYRARIELIAGDEAAVLVALTDLTTLKRAEQLRADFVANASHELRTPLSAVIGFIETLEGPAADDAEARTRFLPIMRQQAARMARLVDDLLSLSRIELNEHLPPRETVDLMPILEDVARSLELKAKARGMVIEMDPPEEATLVIGEDEELAQIFQNLIDNAIKYGAEGSPVTVTIHPSQRLRAGLAVTIRDRGEGIAREFLPRLTERFYRVDSARSRAMGGTGLGLAIVKHIVSRHRGILEIDSEIGTGSTFTVHLPSAATLPVPVLPRAGAAE